MRVLISGGGTGGHVYPLLTVAEALNALDDREVDILYVGSADGMEASIVGRTNLAYRVVESAPLVGVAPWKLLAQVGTLWRGVRQAIRLLAEWPADVVLVSGGYVSVPTALAARQRHVPVMIYLPDREPGLAVRFLGRFVDRIAVSFQEIRSAFPAAQRHKVWVSGYPVRAALLHADRAAGYALLGLDPRLKTLLVLGGSQGARPINRALVALLPELLTHCQIVHVTGHLDGPWVREEWDRLLAELPNGVGGSPGAGGSPPLQARYRAYPYLHEELAAAMAVADLVVARAGAATLAEFPALGLPSILVPYPYSGQHQGANADFMVTHGAALRLDDADLDTQLKPTVLRLLGDEQTLERMGEKARALSRPDAASRLAGELCRLAQMGKGGTR